MNSTALPGVPGEVHCLGLAWDVENIVVGEGGHLRDWDDLGARVAGERDHRSVELRPRQVLGQAGVALSQLGPLGYRFVVLVDPHARGPFAARSLGKADVVRVGVGQDHRVQVVQAVPERVERPQEQLPVPWRAGIDEGQAAGLFDQVEVGGCARDPVYPWGNFGWGDCGACDMCAFLSWTLVGLIRAEPEIHRAPGWRFPWTADGRVRGRRLSVMRDHWWWRPGWRPGRRMYTWHVTFGDQPAVQDLAARARDLLSDVPGVDLIPGPWLHLTTQGVGFSDEVSAADLAAITAAARSRLAAVPPAAVTIGPARVVDEGIVCDAHPAAMLRPVRDALRAVIGDAWGRERVPGQAEWWPHVSLAYASADGPSAPAETALAGFDEAVAITVTEVQLILLGRDEHLYQWETQATVRLGPPGR
jgi:hypothetical protein